MSKPPLNRGPMWLLSVMLVLAGCGSNGNGWRGMRQVHDASVPRPGHSGHGPRYRAEWQLPAYAGLVASGALDLYPPPVQTGDTERALPIQSDLSTSQHLLFTVEVSDRPWDRKAPKRTIQVEVLIRGHAILDGVPEDEQPVRGLEHPALQAGHRAEIWIYPGLAAAGGLEEVLSIEGTGTARTLEEDTGGDSLLAYDFQGSLSLSRVQRIEDLVIASRAERERLADLSEIVALQLITLDEYRASKGRGQSDRIFARADEILRMLRWHTETRQWQDPALHKYRDGLAEIAESLQRARDAAWDSRPRSKSVGETVVDAAKVVPHVVETVADGVVETGRMVRDLGTYTADAFGEGVGLYDIEWEPWSAVGQAYASGKSTSEIAWSMVDGLLDSVDEALYAAEHGDYSLLMNLGGDLVVEVLLVRGFGQAARTSKVPTPRAAVSMGERVAKRYQNTLVRMRAMRERLARAKNIPGRVRDELDALAETFGRAIQPQMVTAGSPISLVSGIENLRHIYASARLEKTTARTLSILENRGVFDGPGGPRRRAAVEALGRSSSSATASAASSDVLAYVAKLDDAAPLLRALDETLAVSSRFDGDAFAVLVRNAVHSADTASYLDDIRWLASLDSRTRGTLANLITQSRAPDLAWLRAADLDAKTLRDLILDPDTDWPRFQRRAQLAEGLPPEVRALIGTRVGELKTPPPGTEFWAPKKGRRQLRWKRDHAAGRPSLTVDSQGRIVVGGADDLNRAALGRNMRKSGVKLRGHQDHHIIPIEVARDHELFRAARRRGSPPWDPNHPDNGIQLPANEAARNAYSASHDLPIHRGNHKDYTDMVERLANTVLKVLESEYGHLDKVPPRVLGAAAKQVQKSALEALRRWVVNHGGTLR